MSELSIRERRKVHLITYEGVTSREAEDFLVTMETAGESDPAGYASFLAALDERIEQAKGAADARGDVRNARSAIEAALRASSGRPTAGRVREIQRALEEH